MISATLARVVFNSAVICSIAGCAPAFGQTIEIKATNVAVVTNDYSFSGLPKVIGAGPVMFSMENAGKVRHEMSIILLKADADIEAVREGTVSPASRAVAERLIGLLIARPGEQAGGKLYVELKAGERYLVVCTLKDAPTGPPHSRLGMITSFEVR